MVIGTGVSIVRLISLLNVGLLFWLFTHHNMLLLPPPPPLDLISCKKLSILQYSIVANATLFDSLKLLIMIYT